MANYHYTVASGKNAMIKSFVLTRGALESFVKELHRFHGQEIYAELGSAIVRKKPYFHLVFLLIRSVSRSRLGNFFLLCGVLLGYRVFRYPLPGRRIFQYGVSQNNVLSFERLNHCLAKQGVSDISMNARPASLIVRLKACFSLGAMWMAAGVLSQSCHKRPLVHVQTVIGCASLLLYSRNPLPSEVKVVCVASDHSPVCQALLFLARKEARKTCYIQHAPVSDHFPPLIYDLSILFDRASLLAYEHAGVRQGSMNNSTIVLLSPFKEEFRRPRIGQKPYNIGFCLSFLPNLKKVSEILSELSSNPHVSRILLRPHPRCRKNLSHLLEIEKVDLNIDQKTADGFFRTVDIVLVPNSGVTIESLHSGRPTFYVPKMDFLPDDYYGFVKNGVIPIFKSNDIQFLSRMMAFFDESWVKRFSYYDETVNKTHIEASSQVGEAFFELLS